MAVHSARRIRRSFWGGEGLWGVRAGAVVERLVNAIAARDKPLLYLSLPPSLLLLPPPLSSIAHTI